MAGLVQLTPLNDRATEWLRATVSSEASWRQGALVVEIRYFAGLADAAIDAGLLFERGV